MSKQYVEDVSNVLGGGVWVEDVDDCSTVSWV
jgi:hypothetical protein